MRYAHFDPTTPNPHAILAWYHVQDANDPDGMVYPNLPASSGLAVVPDAIWSDTMGRANGAYCVGRSGATPTVIATPGPTAAQQLASAQRARIMDLYASFNAASHADIAFTNAAAVAATYQSDELSRARISRSLASYTPGGAVPTGFYWVDAANVQQAMTLADLQALAKAIADREWSLFQHLQSKKAQVNTATTVAAVQAVTW